MKIDFWIFIIFLLQLQTCSGLEVTVPSNPETGMAGSSVVVPCIYSLDFNKMEPKLLHVRWIFRDKVLLMFSKKELTSYGRATLDKEAAMNGNVSLLLYGLKVEDEGTYTCSVEYIGELHVKEVQLRVQASPSVEVTMSSTKSDDKMNLDCLVKGFYPKEVNVTWYRNGEIVNNGVITSEPRKEGNGTYDVNSTLVIISSKIKKDELAECRVEHVSMATPIKEHFVLTQIGLKRNSVTLVSISTVTVFLVMALCRGLYWALCNRLKSKSNVVDEESVKPAVEPEAELLKCPRMGEIMVPRMVNGTKAFLQCTISGYCPENLNVTWLWMKPGTQQLLSVSPSDNKTATVEIKREKDKTYTCTACLSINVSVSGENSAQYVCQVEHPSLERPLQKRTGKLQVIGIPVIKVRRETRRKKTYLTAVIEGIFPLNFTIKWSRMKNNKLVDYPEPDKQKKSSINIDGTYNVISSIKVEQSRARKSKSFKVTINHESLESPIQQTILREEGVYYLLTENGRNRLP
uniref:Ig-like domain-containing protein n=1 Tax=Leptobrachium leishanense TaxID=445787 RepID=A0A8C5MUD0_9ANUR